CVAGIQYQKVLPGLRGKDAFLGCAIIFKAAVTVQMVGGDVENDSDGRMELLRGFELKAGYLQNRPAFVSAGVDECHDRNADVAANQRRQSASSKDFAQQSRGGGLSVGTCDGQDFAFEE